MKKPNIITQGLSDNQIAYMESDKNYTVIHLTNGQRLMSGYHLSFYEKLIDQSVFIRLNRSIMVNKLSVGTIDVKAYEMTLSSGRKISISRRRIKAIQSWI